MTGDPVGDGRQLGGVGEEGHAAQPVLPAPAAGAAGQRMWVGTSLSTARRNNLTRGDRD
jgi:hypothetical protein